MRYIKLPMHFFIYLIEKTPQFRQFFLFFLFFSFLFFFFFFFFFFFLFLFFFSFSFPLFFSTLFQLPENTEKSRTSWKRQSASWYNTSTSLPYLGRHRFFFSQQNAKKLLTKIDNSRPTRVK